MGKTTRVINNSGLLMLQALVMNIISVIAIGYIARRLGKNAYGQFIFGIGFIGVFVPFTNLGLRAYTVRSIAQDKSTIPTVISKVAGTRLILSTVITIAAIAATFVLSYDRSRVAIVSIYAWSLILTAIASTYQDAFQALEKMSHVALIQFISGIVVTITSVWIVSSGMGAYGLITTYLFAAAVGAFLSVLIYTKHFGKTGLHFDYKHSKASIIESTPFFWPNLIWLSGSKLGLLFLASISGDATVGLYGAANNLVEKLVVIPDSLCTSFFPAMCASFRQSPEEASLLFKRFYRYLVVLGLPIAVGTTILAPQIITLVFGSDYVRSTPILQVLIWGMYVSFLTTLKFWTIGAVSKEKIGGYIAIASTIVQVLCGFLLIPFWGGLGLAISSLISACITFVMLRIALCSLSKGVLIKPAMRTCIIISNIIMGAITHAMSNVNLILVISISALAYLVSIIMLGVVTSSELNFVKTHFRKKLGLLEPDAAVTKG